MKIGRMNRPKNFEAMDGKLPVDDKIGEQRTLAKAKECCKTLDCDDCPLREAHWCKEMLHGWANDELEGF